VVWRVRRAGSEADGAAAVFEGGFAALEVVVVVRLVSSRAGGFSSSSSSSCMSGVGAVREGGLDDPDDSAS
jgi:hypothetical protein